MNVSIVIYKSNLEQLSNLLKDLENPLIKKIFVIDNAPDESIKDFICSSSSKAEYMASPENIGYGSAHNIAMRKSIAEGQKYHLVLNPDIELNQGTLKELKTFMDNEPNTGLIMPQVFYPDNTIQYLCKLLPAPMDWIGRRFLPFSNYIKNRNERFELRKSGYDKIMNIPYLSGCFMFFRTDVLKEVGLFDEKIFMYGEDTDICRRIHKSYQTLFYPNVSIIHHYNKESYRSKRLLKIHIKSAIYYFNKWGWFFDRERKRINRETVEKYLQS